MTGKKRCPFSRRDCDDRCALYEMETRRCAIACIATQAQRMANELYYLAEVAAPQTGKEDKA